MFGLVFGFSLMVIGVCTLVLWTLVEKRLLPSSPGHSDTGIVVVSCCAVFVVLGCSVVTVETMIEAVRLIVGVL